MKIHILIILLCISTAFSSNYLSLEEVFKETLAKNYSINISKIEQENAKNSSTVLNSGLLPTASLSAAAGYANGKSKTSTSMSDIDRTNTDLSIQLSYTIFDGLYNINNYKLYKELHNASQLETESLIELVLVQSSSAYLAVQVAQNLLKITQENLTLSQSRVDMAQSLQKFGQNNSTDVLSAEVDWRNDSTILIKAMQALRNAKINLNLIMVREDNLDFTVDSTISLSTVPPMDAVEANALKRDYSLKLSEANSKIAKIQKKMAASAFIPRLNFSTAYGLSDTEKGLSLAMSNDPADLFSASLQLSWNIFDGRSVSAYKNLKNDITSNELKTDETKLKIKTEVLSVYDSYTTALAIIQKEKETIILAKKVLDHSKELYKNGQINSTTLRDRQQSVFESEHLYFQSLADAKNYELQIRRLNGSL